MIVNNSGGNTEKNNNRNNVLLISSQVICGTVGSRASGFALEALGTTVWIMLTVSMTWHPGHGKAHRMIVGANDFSAFADDILASAKVPEINAVMTGYFASAEQVTIAARLIRALMAKKPDLIYLCDPVMADEEGLYIDETVASAICNELVPLATILKPNRSELEWMCNRQLDTNDKIIETASEMTANMVLVTSAPALLKNATANLLVYDGNAFLAEHRILDNPVNGLGDLTSALFLHHILDHLPPEKALQQTTAAVFDCLAYALHQESDELLLECSVPFFKKPTTMVTLRTLSRPKRSSLKAD